VNRRRFLRLAGLAAVTAMPGLARAGPRGGRNRPAAPQPFVVPMDDAQPQPLRAYGVVYRALRQGGTADWLLNHRGGSFLVHHPPAYEDSLEHGVMTESASDPVLSAYELSLSGGQAPVRLEVAPEIAVYAPPYAAPWDDAVRLALEFADIPYRVVWDRDVLGTGLADIDWLHLHHEDFTGQYGKYGLNVRSTDWYREAVRVDKETATELGFGDTRPLKRAVAMAIREYVNKGGFLFAMCAATETLDIALAGDPPDFSGTLSFTDFSLEAGDVGPFSTIDGHRVNTPDRRVLDAVQVAQFAPTVDPVAAMLTQNHRLRFPDWYGLTTSFQAALKPGVLVLATCANRTLAKYVHGDLGAGTFTFLGGHDPEDPQHAIGDPPTDLEYHPRSPGYRLILNNVLFPAARQEERKT
jgi:hypothetical protein